MWEKKQQHIGENKYFLRGFLTTFVVCSATDPISEYDSGQQKDSKINENFFLPL